MLETRRSGPPRQTGRSTTTSAQGNAGSVLAATEAMRWRRGELWTDAEVAYVASLAYDTGRLHGYSEEMAETVASWQEFAQPRPTREDRVARRLAEMPPPRPQRYDDPDWPPVTVPGAGGLRLGFGQVVYGDPLPPTYFPADPNRVRPRFPSLEQQSAWLTPEDVAFCRRYAKETYQ